MAQTAHSIDVESLMSQPLYTLNLSAAQRCVLAWIEEQGGMWEPIETDAEELSARCFVSESTAYEALARLTRLNVLIKDVYGHYRINARYALRDLPHVRDMITAALTDPELSPDERAKGPLKESSADVRRRRTLKAVQ